MKVFISVIAAFIFVFVVLFGYSRYQDYRENRSIAIGDLENKFEILDGCRFRGYEPVYYLRCFLDNPLACDLRKLNIRELKDLDRKLSSEIRKCVYQYPPEEAESDTVCDLDVKFCSDGSEVGRVPPYCEFELCADEDFYDNPGELTCGGIAGFPCPDGYICELDGNYPDAGGYCVEEVITGDYQCPANGWQNCMPILSEEGQKACSREAIAWYEVNCPDFQGVAQ